MAWREIGHVRSPRPASRIMGRRAVGRGLYAAGAVWHIIAQWRLEQAQRGRRDLGYLGKLNALRG